MGRKFAVRLLFPVMLMVAGLLDPLSAPPQLLKSLSAAGAALSCTEVPRRYEFAVQFGTGWALMEPQPDGLTDLDSL